MREFPRHNSSRVPFAPSHCEQKCIGTYAFLYTILLYEDHNNMGFLTWRLLLLLLLLVVATHAGKCFRYILLFVFYIYTRVHFDCTVILRGKFHSADCLVVTRSVVCSTVRHYVIARFHESICIFVFFSEEKIERLPEDCGRFLNFKFFVGNRTEFDDYPWLALLEYDTREYIQHNKKNTLSPVAQLSKIVWT